jgi:hypothetical protein
VVAAALAAFALVPTAATAHAGEASASGPERAALTWTYVKNSTDAACHRDGDDWLRRGWIAAYDCRWHPPLQFGIVEFWIAK